MPKMNDHGWHDDRVSIIMPAYKAARIIGESIQSVLNQTHEDWELLITNDMSPDNTAEVVQQWVNSDPRIHLINAPLNGGPASARNLSLARARGRWIAFLDSDDLWLPEKLERQLVFHRAAACLITFTEFRRISGDGLFTGQLLKVPDRANYVTLLKSNVIANSTALVDRLLTGPFSMRKMYCDDHGCWLDLLRSGGEARGLHEDLMRYRVVSGSVSRNKFRAARETWKTYREMERLSFFSSAYYFMHYAVNASFKYRKF